MTRLTQRIQCLEAHRRSAHVAAVLARARQCPPAALGACLLAELTSVDRATAHAIMDQLTEAELTALLGPEAGHCLDMLSDVELHALARGDLAATRQAQRLLRSGHNQGDPGL